MTDMRVEGGYSVRSKAMLADLCRQQLDLVLDPNPYVSDCGSRRAGKTTAIAVKTIIQGEERPGHMTIIGAPEKLWLEQNYWGKAESGIPVTAAKYGLTLETNVNRLTWAHANGSRGVLLGMKDQKAIEAWMGMEANLYALDEMHRVNETMYALAMDKVIGPQALSRKAQVLVAGNPGDVCSGQFWRATDPDRVRWGLPQHPGASKGCEGGPAVPWERMVELSREERLASWSFHHMTMQGNTAMPDQWEGALALKRKNRWDDDAPLWIQQYLGLWVRNPAALRFAWNPATEDRRPQNQDLTSLGVWLTTDVAFFVALFYDVDTGLMSPAWVGQCDGDPETVVKTYARCVDVVGGDPAWTALGGPGVSEVLYHWFLQASLQFERHRNQDHKSALALTNGALKAGRLRIPGDSLLALQLQAARKSDEFGSPGTELTDALLVAVGQLPAPPVPDGPQVPEAENPLPLGHPFRPAYLPPRQGLYRDPVEEDPAPLSWEDFVKQKRT